MNNQVYWSGAWFDKLLGETDQQALDRLNDAMNDPQSQYLRPEDNDGREHRIVEIYR